MSAHHVAIMKPSWKLIPKILSGEKTIESRWYVTRRAPWNAIAKGDIIFFKDSGASITAWAEVAHVQQFEFTPDTPEGFVELCGVVAKYGDAICMINREPATWNPKPRYAILITLTNPQHVTHPFQINKKGFGAPAAWLTVPHIDTIRLAS